MAEPCMHPVGDPIEDADGQPDVTIGVDHDKVTVSLGQWQPGAQVIALDREQAEDFAAYFVAACWQAGRNAALLTVADDFAVAAAPAANATAARSGHD